MMLRGSADPAERLRILFVTESVPYPPIWGFGIRVYQLLRQLSGRHSVSLLTYARPNDGDSLVVLRQMGIAVHTVPYKHLAGGRKRMTQLSSLLSPASFQSRCLHSEAMQAAIDRLLAAEQFDIVQVESSQMSGFDFGSRVVTLLDEHNIEYELLYRMCRTERSPVRKAYNWIDYLKFRREERHAWERAAGCILTSAREEAILRQRLPAKPTVVVPNGVDVDYFQPVSGRTEPGNIVFTGLMRYRPNADAAVHFVREILPLIRREHPEVTFSVVGAGAPLEVQRLAGANVVVTGTVPDVRPYVQRATIFAVPLRMGGGTRLKVLEGLAMGKAMVSTGLGCEGIAVRDGEHLLVADDPPAFAQAVLRLLDDPAMAARLAENGRRLVEAEYSWPSVARYLENFYTQMLNMPATAVH